MSRETIASLRTKKTVWQKLFSRRETKLYFGKSKLFFKRGGAVLFDGIFSTVAFEKLFAI